jgi:hypothetical protein
MEKQNEEATVARSVGRRLDINGNCRQGRSESPTWRFWTGRCEYSPWRWTAILRSSTPRILWRTARWILWRTARWLLWGTSASLGAQARLCGADSPRRILWSRRWIYRPLLLVNPFVATYSRLGNSVSTAPIRQGVDCLASRGCFSFAIPNNSDEASRRPCLADFRRGLYRKYWRFWHTVLMSRPPSSVRPRGFDEICSAWR